MYRPKHEVATITRPKSSYQCYLGKRFVLFFHFQYTHTSHHPQKVQWLFPHHDISSDKRLKVAKYKRLRDSNRENKKIRVLMGSQDWKEADKK